MSFTDEIYALVVDDSEMHAELAANQLESRSDYLVTEYVTSAEEALDRLESDSSIGAVVSDYCMPDMDGLELLDEINSEYDVPFIMFTGQGSEEIAVEALQSGAEDYVTKSSSRSIEKLSNRVENAAIKHRAEEELSMLKAGLDNAGHAVKVLDSECNIIYVNEAMEEATGYSQDELLGEDPSIITADEDGEEFYEEFCSNLDSDEIWHGEILKEDRDGEEYWIDQTLSPITDQNGNIKYLIAVSNDITEKKEMEQRRELLNSMLRHDVGNDIQTLTGFIEILQGTDLDDEQQEYVDTIQECAEKSNQLLHGVRDLLKNDPKAERKEINLEDTVEEVLDHTSHLAESRGIEIQTELENDESYPVQAGPLLNQALSNLVENAIVHPDQVETVTIGAEKNDDSVELYVSDDGEGLPEDFSFTKGDKGEESDGTGLGTWLASEIAEAYGKGIEAGESEEGGAEFVIRLDSRHSFW